MPGKMYFHSPELPKAGSPSNCRTSKVALKNAYVIVASTVDKGRGMFAGRDIAAGQIILVKRPVIIFSKLAPKFLVGGKTCSDVAFDHLDGAIKDEALKLHNCKPKEVCDLREGIIRTNGIGIDLAPSTKDAMNLTHHTGIFLKLSMSNHRYVKSPLVEPTD